MRATANPLHPSYGGTDMAAPMNWPDLLARAQSLASSAGRRILGITGAPGAGKSTLAQRLVGMLGDVAVLVAMDGYHLAQAELERLGRAERKGAPDTFDAAGYVALLQRLRAPDADTVYAPEFRRAIEEPIAGAVAVPPDVPLVVTEGNYLLLDTEPWSAVRGLLDEVWFLAPDERTRRAWLIARHCRYGRTPEQAAARAAGSDEHNARLIAQTSGRADLIVAPTQWPTWPNPDMETYRGFKPVI
jgi:pantothenate kinase